MVQTMMGIRMVIMMAHTGIAMMIEAAETMVEAVGREYLVMGTIGMMTIEDSKTTMKIDMTHSINSRDYYSQYDYGDDGRGSSPNPK